MSERVPSNCLILFSLVPDPRKSGHLIRRDLFDMIFIAIAARVSGVDDREGICLRGESQKNWLRKFCTLTNGIPSEWTFRRVFRLLDPNALQEAFTRWMRGIEKATGSVLAVDGKTLRRSFDRKDARGRFTWSARGLRKTARTHSRRSWTAPVICRATARMRADTVARIFAVISKRTIFPASVTGKPGPA